MKHAVVLLALLALSHVGCSSNAEPPATAELSDAASDVGEDPDAEPPGVIHGTCTSGLDCHNGWICQRDDSAIAGPSSCRKKLPTCLPNPCDPDMVCVDVVVVDGTHPYSYCEKKHAIGEACGACVDGASCVQDRSASPPKYTCEALIAAGAKCDADHQCVKGYGCLQGSLGSVDRICKPQNKAGGTCLDDRSCIDGTWCGPESKCSKRGDVGDACTPSTTVISLQCLPHLQCDRKKATCQPLEPAKL